MTWSKYSQLPGFTIAAILACLAYVILTISYRLVARGGVAEVVFEGGGEMGSVAVAEMLSDFANG